MLRKLKFSQKLSFELTVFIKALKRLLTTKLQSKRDVTQDYASLVFPE